MEDPLEKRALRREVAEVVLNIQIEPEGISPPGAKVGIELLEDGCLTRLTRSDQHGYLGMIKMLRQRGHEPTLYVLVLCIHGFILAREIVMSIYFYGFSLSFFIWQPS
jgi:hypothetical protein